MQNISDISPVELKSLITSLHFSEDIYSTIIKNYYRKKIFDPSKWDNISKSKISTILEHISLERPKIIWKANSEDGTRKYLIGLKDHQSVETVAIPTKDRVTICLSSQVGCAIGCKFCHTGTMGLSRNLSSSEIVGQLLCVEEDLKKDGLSISNIVFMGQGEPMHNFDEVKKACQIFLDPNGICLSKQRVTISTSGLVHKMKKWDELPDVNIAISLHAVTDNKRDQIMPINKTHDLERLFDTIRNLPQKPSRRISFEYILMHDFNDSLEDVEGLDKLLSRKNSKINIIPFNDYPGSKFKSPSQEKVKWFQKELQNRGFITTIRQTRGEDILAACGQLKSNLEKENIW